MTQEIPMTQIRNVSPRGALEVPLLGRTVDAGEAVEVSEDHAARLLAQTDNWQPVRPTRKTADEKGAS